MSFQTETSGHPSHCVNRMRVGKEVGWERGGGGGGGEGGGRGRQAELGNAARNCMNNIANAPPT